MQQTAQMPVYDPGNAPEISGTTINVTVEGSLVIFQICVPRTVGGERVNYVTGYAMFPKESIAGNIAKTELALVSDCRERMYAS